MIDFCSPTTCIFDKEACAAKGIFLQAAISVAAEKGVLNNPDLAKAIVGLASLRHSHVALNPAILLQVAKDDETFARSRNNPILKADMESGYP